MDITVKHNGTNITTHVLSYEREHKICTGIGILTLDVERTINRTFDPWDSIDIWENGSFQVRYYISSVDDNVPEGKLKIDCQDLSKKLVDYFIPDSYNIDYPSYTRYWIQKFLDEANVTYQFNTTSQGNLLSNNTQLGLKPLYEEILTLLQLSGWYMYFDGNGKAVIGPLETDLASTTRRLEKTDITSISKISDDKMLRNRALVLGAFDPYSLTYSTADITIHTRWNYDRNDVRAMVVVNSNIPNKGSAYSIANMLLKEFARITVEKHIIATGARNWNLGEAVRVTSNVWRGKGLITTFGVRMSKDGLFTDLVLDERCPRLFGFFNFGDYVYVGTFGNGIWRKHLRFDPTWYDFSSGLTNLNITDLHINNGVFGSIASQGEMYYTLSEDGGWSKVTLTGLMSSADNVSQSGVVHPIMFSGIMGRAVIVDKQSNIIRYGVDTAPYMNYGDYFIDYSGWTTTSFSGMSLGSGMVSTSGWRGWILEYDFFTGSGVTSYPISVSGDYNLRVIDLENDGFNDYVSVAMGGQGTIPMGLAGYDLGHQNTAGVWDTRDVTAIVSSPIFPDGTDLDSDSVSGIITDDASMVLIDDGITGERDIIWWDSFLGQLRMERFYKDIDNTVQSNTTSTAFSHSSKEGLRIYRVQQDLYRIFYTTTGVNTLTISYVEWNVSTNILSSSSSIYTFTPPAGHLDTNVLEDFDSISVGNKAYILIRCFEHHVLSGGLNVNPQYYQIHMVTINLDAITASSSQLYQLVTAQSPTLPGGYIEYVGGSANHSAAGSFGGGQENYRRFGLFQNGDTEIKIVGWLEYGYDTNNTAGTDNWTELLFTGNSTSISASILNNASVSRFDDSSFSGTSTNRLDSQLTRTLGMIVTTAPTTPSKLAFATNGSTFVTFNGAYPYYLNPDRIYPMFGLTPSQYIARDNSNNYWACDAVALAPGSQITAPVGYELLTPFSNNLSFTDAIYWTIQNIDTLDVYLAQAPSVIASPTGGYTTGFSTVTRRGINVGGFFVHEPNWSLSNPQFTGNYVYFGANELESAEFLVLRRDGAEFTVIEREAYPIRTDISNISPVFTVGSGDSTFKSNYVYPDSLEVIFAVTGSGRKVEDYRYTLLEPTFSGISASGLAVQTLGVYVLGSGVFAQDIRTYSGGWQSIFSVPSGWGKRIETSNYGLGGQYIFVTSSGFVQTFYQKNPEEVGFLPYSGMPQARATIIRLDDRI